MGGFYTPARDAEGDVRLPARQRRYHAGTGLLPVLAGGPPAGQACSGAPAGGFTIEQENEMAPRRGLEPRTLRLQVPHPFGQAWTISSPRRVSGASPSSTAWRRTTAFRPSLCTFPATLAAGLRSGFPYLFRG